VSVQEAMAAGLPVITSEFVGSSVDLVKEDKNGFTYKSQSIIELKERLLNALSLNPIEVKKTNDIILKNWDYTSTFNTLLRLIDK
jgi:glycosyltransferase involved in cell wall biosynthesis